MFWLYSDDSAVHRADGSVSRLAVCGGIAPCDSWARLTVDWCNHLASFRRHKITWFHMTDFEARQKPFHDLTDAERRRLLRGLLDIALKHVPIFFGTVDEPTFEPSWRRYGGHVLKTQKELSRAAHASGQKIGLVLARQPNIRAERLGRFIDQWADPSVFEFAGFGEPRMIPPLQVADIVAYEFSRAMRENKPQKERYPLTRLKEATQGCHLLSAKFLKRMEI